MSRSYDNAEKDFTGLQAYLGQPILNWAVPENVRAVYNASAYLNGSSTYITIADSASLVVGSSDLDVTITAFNAQSSIAANESIIGQWAASGNQRSWLVYLDTNRKLNISFSSDGASLSGNWQSTNAVNTDLFNGALRFVKSGTTLTVTIGGASVAGGLSSGSIPASLHNSTAALIIGAHDGGTASTVWDGVLTAPSILIGGVAVYTAAGEGTANSNWVDTSGSGNNGTVVGSPALFTGQGYYADGRRVYDYRVPTNLQAMRFQGSQYVLITPPSGIYGTNGRRFKFKLTAGVSATADPDYVVFAMNNANTGGTANEFFCAYESQGLAIGVDGGRYITGSFITVGTEYDIEIRMANNANLSQVQLYVNGVLQSWTLEQGTDQAVNTSNDGTFSIGSKPTGASIGANGFNGIIREFEIQDVSGNKINKYAGNGIYSENWTGDITGNVGTIAGSPRRCLRNDVTTLANDAFQDTAAIRPRYIENGAVNVGDNGLPCLRFGGTSRYMQSNYTLPTTMSFFFVGEVTGADGVAFGALNSAASYRQYFGVNLSGKYGSAYGTSAYSSFVSVVDSGSLILASTFYNGTSGTGYINGGNQYTHTPATVGSTTNVPFYVFALNNNGSPINYASGDFQALIIYPSDQSANRVAIENYLNSKFEVY